MNEGLMFNLVLIVIVLILSGAVLYRRHKDKHPSSCDPQLQAVHEYLNESITLLLAKMERKIEDHFEDEYVGDDHLLQDQLNIQRDLTVDFGAFCVKVSGYPGYPRHVKEIRGIGIDLSEHWELVLATGPTSTRSFAIPHANIAHLIDNLVIINDNNKVLIDMIKSSEQ